MNIYKFLIYILIMITGPISISFSKEKEENSLLKSMCMIAFNHEMKVAQKVPPEGMQNYTCKCFLDEVSFGTRIQRAQERCKEKASSKFEL